MPISPTPSPPVVPTNPPPPDIPEPTEFVPTEVPIHLDTPTPTEIGVPTDVPLPTEFVPTEVPPTWLDTPTPTSTITPTATVGVTATLVADEISRLTKTRSPENPDLSEEGNGEDEGWATLTPTPTFTSTPTPTPTPTPTFTPTPTATPDGDGVGNLSVEESIKGFEEEAGNILPAPEPSSPSSTPTPGEAPPRGEP
ncbi:MAG: hypothetical protein HC884_09725 [Chloroflexaceae bacterium]|nr:hypothetical protein [Chloroflexaceae bacterium]